MSLLMVQEFHLVGICSRVESYFNAMIRLLCVVFICLVSLAPSVPSDPGSQFPYNDYTPYPYDTYVPINVQTETAKPIFLTPLVLTIPDSNPWFYKNIGFTEYVYQISGQKPTLTGGVLFNNRYIFEMEAFNNDASIFGRASSTEDFAGTPLQTQLFFYNEKYGSFSAALGFRDGLAIILVNVVVAGNIPNTLFFPVQGALASIKQPNTTANISSGAATRWFTYALNNCHYYAYPGAYIDITTSEQYFCATMIQIPKSFLPYISIKQFNSFLQVLNRNNQTTANALSLFDQGSRPVIETGPVKVVHQ